MIHYFLTNSEDVLGAAIVTGFIGIIFGFSALLTMVAEVSGQASISQIDRRIIRVALGILVYGILSLTVTPLVVLVFLVWVPPIIKHVGGIFWFACKVAFYGESTDQDPENWDGE